MGDESCAMIVSEIDAKTKACPFGDAHKTVKANGGNCIASACMLWRQGYSPMKGDVGFCGLSGQGEQSVLLLDPANPVFVSR